MKPKLKKYDLVEIIWEDTNIPLQPGWMTEAEHQEWVKNAGSKVRSIGIYISEDESFINLVGDMEADECESKSYLRPINVGKGFIKSIRKLR
ncbi:MAG: hypothetical protein WC332_01040 [Clostridia bacterium]|jgi:hypothetical protein